MAVASSMKAASTLFGSILLQEGKKPSLGIRKLKIPSLEKSVASLVFLILQARPSFSQAYQPIAASPVFPALFRVVLVYSSSVKVYGATQWLVLIGSYVANAMVRRWP